MGYPILVGALIALLSLSALGQGVMPTPHCKFRPIYTTLPLNLNEILTGDLTGFSTGYNIEFRVATGNDTASVKQKLVLNDRTQQKFSRVVSHHVEQRGNSWGTGVHFVVESGNATYLWTGTLKEHSSVPVLDDPVLVEYSSNTRCFDAVVFREQHLAIVDCVVFSTNSVGLVGLRNQFIYVDLNTRQPTKHVNNEMYVSFMNITARRMTRFHDDHTGYWYVIRTYIVAGVDAANVGNTYMELFDASDANDLQILRVVDRSYLGLSVLAITDFKVYLGDIFVLDYGSGLIRLDITKGQHLTVFGHLRQEGFRRFSVYSDNLQEQLLVVLANTHAVHQINWEVMDRPLLVSKYSLMPNSHVNDISVDAKYLVVQATSNGTSDLGNLTINYTWIFTKNVRTYANAYRVIDHPSPDVFLDLNRETHTLLITGGDGLYNYQINDPILNIMQGDTSKMGASLTVLIEGNSTDPHSPAQQICTSRTTVVIVQPDNMTIWKSGITVPDEYYANYPGVLEVFLHDYVIGPNISYWITQPSTKEELPQFWINKRNESLVKIDRPPDVKDINFFHTDVVPHYGNDTIIYYYQNSQNITHSASCTHLADDLTIYCSVGREYSHRSRIHSFTSGVFADSRGFSEYYYAFTLEGAKNVVTMVDYIAHNRLAVIELPEGYEGQVEDLAITNGILFATVPAIKTIFAYKLAQCAEFVCPLAFKVDLQALKPLGVLYFSPQRIVTSRQHPEVLFIKNKGSLMVLDVDNHQRLVLLAEMFSAALQDPQYKLAVNRNSMVVVSPPGTIEHYDLRQLYQRTVMQVKSYCLYHYQLQEDFDLEFSDVGDLFYVNALDTRSNRTSVLIYRTASYAVAALYDVINLPGLLSHRNLEIEVSGFGIDYVSIIASGEFYLYRLYEQPHVTFIDTFNDFHFRINYGNGATKDNLTDVAVRIANYPEDFRPTDEFKKKKDALKIENDTYFSVDTRKWFDGHIIRYNWTCDDCHNGKVRVKNHVSLLGRLQLNGFDYTETWRGGLVLNQDVFRLGINGTIQEVISIPSQRGNEECMKTVSRGDDSLIVTGCEQFGYGVNLYVTSKIGFKAFTWGPYESEAIYLRNLQLVHNIIAVVDVDMTPWRRYRSGGVYLYATQMNRLTNEQLVELDYIDSNDFQDAHGWDFDSAYIGNAHLVYDELDNAYRLYLTEVGHGLFVMDFKHTPGSSQIQVLTSNFVDLNKLLKDNNLHMPKDAFFEAVTLTNAQYNSPHFEIENIVVTTSGFHNFEITLVYDEARLISSILHRVYYRYAFYESTNFVRSAGNYLAVGYSLPEMFEWTEYSRQLIVVYDAKDYPGDAVKGYSERYMMGAHTIDHSHQSTFGFNTTYDAASNGTRLGLVVIDRRYGTLTEMSLSRNLTIEVLDPAIKDQKIKLTPYNDFSRITFEVEVVNGSPIPPTPDDGDVTLEIIIVIVGAVVVVTCLGYLIILFTRRPYTELEKSLIEDPEPAHQLRETLVTRDSLRDDGIQTRRESVEPESQSDSVVDAPIAVEELEQLEARPAQEQ